MYNWFLNMVLFNWPHIHSIMLIWILFCMCFIELYFHCLLVVKYIGFGFACNISYCLNIVCECIFQIIHF